MIDPLVSIKMITYNHAPFIAQAVEGVLQQKTDFLFELVIGEDCSTDGTRELVFEYQKKHPDIIRVITSDKNVGMKKNSLRAMGACRGKYIAFCEGDDFWHHPHKLQKQADYLESHPECGLVYSSYDIYHAKSRKRIRDYLNELIKRHHWQRPENPSILDFLGGKSKIGYGILTCTVMVRRTLCEQLMESDPYLYQSDQLLRGDTQLWAEMAQISHLHYIPESLATYNQAEESATRSKDITKSVRLQIADAELGLYLCNKYNLPPSASSEMEARMCNGLLRLAFHTRNAELAEKIRRKKKTFTYKEWLLYYGAGNLLFHYPFHIATAFRNLFWKSNNQWL
jgi:glycosyltransferase involved in cell wall biosynthesis